MMQGRPMCPQPQGMARFPNQHQWNGPNPRAPRMPMNGPPPQQRPMVKFSLNLFILFSLVQTFFLNKISKSEKN